MTGTFLQINQHIIATDQIAYCNLNQPRGESDQSRGTSPGVRVWLRQHGVNLAPQIAIGQTTHNGGSMPAYLDFFGTDAVRLRRWFATAEGFGAVLVASQYNAGGDTEEQPAPTPSAKGAKVAAAGRG